MKVDGAAQGQELAPAVPQELPKGPRARPLVGHLPDFRRDLLGSLDSWSRSGDVIPLRMGPLPAVLLNHPDHIEELLIARHRDFEKSAAFKVLRRVVGMGLVTNDGEPWVRQRRLVQPAFHRERVAAYSTIMRERTLATLEGWRDGEERDLQADLSALALDIVNRSLFGADVRGEAATVGEAVTASLAPLTAILNSLEFLLPAWVPTPNNVRVRRAVRRLDEVIYQLIAERRASGARGGDLLGMLLEASDGTGSMSDRQLRDEVLTLFLAGHETTAVALGWTLWLLAEHPEVRERLEREVDASRTDEDPTVADIARLRYDDMVLSEALRLYPPAPVLGRRALRDTTIGGYRIRRGTTVIVTPWTVHRDARWFDRPDEFRPERWTPEFAAALPKFAYFPFGGGPRGCVGVSFAKLEATIMLSLIVSRFRLQTVAGPAVVPEVTVTLRPRYGLRMRVRQRVH